MSPLLPHVAARKRRPRAEHEAPEQARLVAILRAAGIFFSASLNGVRLTPRLRAVAHQQGMEPGDPDIVVWQAPPRLGSHGMAIELKRPELRPKTDRAGEWSGAEPHQRERLQRLRLCGWYCVVAYGCDDALRLMREAGYAV